MDVQKFLYKILLYRCLHKTYRLFSEMPPLPSKTNLANSGHTCTSKTAHTFAPSEPPQFNLITGLETQFPEKMSGWKPEAWGTSMATRDRGCYASFRGTVLMMYADSDLPGWSREHLIAPGHSAPVLPAKSVYNVVKWGYLCWWPL